MENFKKIISLIAIVAIITGFGCGLGWTLHAHEWFSAVCVAVLGAAAVPTVVKLFNFLRS